MLKKNYGQVCCGSFANVHEGYDSICKNQHGYRLISS
jgi:hypothetical protein